MHPVLSRVTKTQSEGNLGFASKVDRFNKNKSIATPGPGYYNTEICTRKKEIILAKEDRFKNLNKSEIPGPGAYSEENIEWNKKSYNVLFSEII